MRGELPESGAFATYSQDRKAVNLCGILSILFPLRAPRAAVLLLAHATYSNVQGMLTLVGEKELFLGLGMRGVHSTAVFRNGASTLRKLSLSGHNWTARTRTVLSHCGHGNEDDSGIPRGRAQTP